MRRVIGLVAVCALLLVPALAQASTILQFTEIVFNTPLTVTATGPQSSSISASAAMNVTFNPSFCLVAGCGGAANGTYQFNLTASSTGAAQLTNGNLDITQPYSGTFSFTNGAKNLLTVNFSDILTGSVNGSSPTLASSQPPDTFTGSSNVLNPALFGTPRGFSFSMSNFNSAGQGLELTAGNNSTVRGAVADISGTISVTPAAVSPVPEPASLILLGTGLVGLGWMGRRRANRLGR